MDPEKFAVEFIEELRRSVSDEFKPSIRQAIAIARMLKVMEGRKGSLTLNDYIRACTACVPPEVKDIALAIAYRLINKSKGMGRRWKFPFIPPLFPLPLGIPLPTWTTPLDEESRRVLSKILSGDSKAMKEFKEVAERDPSKAARIFKELERLKPSSLDLDAFANMVAENIRNLSQLYDVLLVSNIIPSDMDRILEETISRYPLNQAFEYAKKIDRMTGLDLRSALIKQCWRICQRTNKFPSPDEVATSPLPIKEWSKLLDSSIKQEVTHSLTKPNALQRLVGLARKLRWYSELCEDVKCAKELRKKSKEIAKMALKLAKEMGEEEERRVREELSKSGIKVGLLSRLTSKDSWRDLNSSKLEEMMKDALKKGDKDTLSKIAQSDLARASRIARKLGALKEFLESLLAGPGENLLLEWYRSRSRMDPSVRNLVKERIKEVLMNVSREYALSRFGGSEGGPLPSLMLKPYDPGEDPSLVDLEESLENILSQGKLPRNVRYEDLLMRSTESSRIAIVLLNDISGSMAGDKLYYMSICSLMLLYAFRRDEVAIAFFESNTYRVKDVDEEISIEDLADELLELEAFGGTCVSRALLWAEEQLKKARAKTRALIILSDCAFYDYEEALALIGKIKRMGTRIFVVTPKWSYEEGIVKALSQMGATVVKIESLAELPDVLTTIITGL